MLQCYGAHFRGWEDKSFAARYRANDTDVTVEEARICTRLELA